MVTKTNSQHYIQYKDYCVRLPSYNKINELVRALLAEAKLLPQDSIVKVKLRKVSSDETIFNFLLTKDQTGFCSVIPCSIKKKAPFFKPKEIQRGQSSKVFKAIRYYSSGKETLLRDHVALLRNFSYPGLQHIEVERNYRVLKHLNNEGNDPFLDSPGFLYAGKRSVGIDTIQYTRVAQLYTKGDLCSYFLQNSTDSFQALSHLASMFSSVERQIEGGVYSLDQKLENFLTDGEVTKGTDLGAALWFVPLGAGGDEFKEEFRDKNVWTQVYRTPLIYTESYSSASVEVFEVILDKFNVKINFGTSVTADEYEALKLRAEKEIVFQLATSILYAMVPDPQQYLEEEMGSELVQLDLDKTQNLVAKLEEVGFDENHAELIVMALDDEPKNRPTVKELRKVVEPKENLVS